MRVGWVVGLVVLTAACTAPSTAQKAPAAASPALTSSGELPLTAVDFRCSLPVFSVIGAPQLQDAFISFPTLTTTPSGSGGRYFDRAVSRWVPVSRQSVSPDGLQYSFTDGWNASPPVPPRVHVVDASTGQDIRVFSMPDAQPYAVVDFTGAGIYLIISFEGIAPGVWRMDPATGAVAKTSVGFYQPAGAGWISVIDPTDPNPVRSALDGQPQPDRIDRRDSAGKTVTWFYKAGFAVLAVAFAGTPSLLVEANYQDISKQSYRTEFWLVTSPGKSVELFGYNGSSQAPSPYADLSSGFYNSIADRQGIWIGSDHSLYLVERSGQILRVYGGSAYPAGVCD
jgi:hypothetical protein